MTISFEVKLEKANDWRLAFGKGRSSKERSGDEVMGSARTEADNAATSIDWSSERKPLASAGSPVKP